MEEPPTMSLFKLIVAYDGTRFNGFQRQITNQDMDGRRQKKVYERPPKRPHFESSTGKRKRVAVTVQDCLEDAILSYCSQTVYSSTETTTVVTTESLCLKFAGRTDKGVHARGQVVAIHLPLAVIDLQEMKKGINSRLPVDISVEYVEQHEISRRSFCV